MSKFFDKITKRTRIIALFISGVLNLLYVASNVLSGLFYHNLWYFSITFLHTVLLIARFYLLYATKNEEDDNLLTDKVVYGIGYCLIAIDFLSLTLCFYSILAESTTSFNGGFIYPILIYGVYSLLASVYGIFLSVKNKSQTYLAYRNLTLTTALFTVYNFVYSLYLSLSVKSRLALISVSLAGSIAFSTSLILAALLIKSKLNKKID